MLELKCSFHYDKDLYWTVCWNNVYILFNQENTLHCCSLNANYLYKIGQKCNIFEKFIGSIFQIWERDVYVIFFIQVIMKWSEIKLILRK